jgi:hypothetical protein
MYLLDIPLRHRQLVSGKDTEVVTAHAWIQILELKWKNICEGPMVFLDHNVSYKWEQTV